MAPALHDQENGTSAGAESSVFPLTPVGKAVVDTEPPTGAAPDCSPVPEVRSQRHT